METMKLDPPLEVFSTCPPSSDADPDQYLRHVIDVARWSEEHGCTGMLIYSDNSQLDPWLLAAVVVQHTRTLSPLVAVQPIYMHPYTVAKAVTSIAYLYRRRLFLNMVAGGFKNDLIALNDATPHDKRYDRLAEYVRIVTSLLEGTAPVTVDGEFYRVDKLKLTPPLPPELRPGVFVSGSSEAGVSTARALGATAIKYPRPAHEEDPRTDAGVASGIRVGIIARPMEADAWTVARARFPEDRTGQITRQLATKVSDSVWHRELSQRPAADGQTPYWMVPFENYKTMCPYLVGGYDRVGEELARYFGAGYRTMILDIPPDAAELRHTREAIAAALQGVR